MVFMHCFGSLIRGYKCLLELFTPVEYEIVFNKSAETSLAKTIVHCMTLLFYFRKKFDIPSVFISDCRGIYFLSRQHVSYNILLAIPILYIEIPLR